MTTTEEESGYYADAFGEGPDPVHFGIARDEPWPDDVPRNQDDSWWRHRGDPRGARRAELRIAAIWTLPVLSAIGLVWVYVDGGQPQVEGALLFTAFLSLGAGLILWARDLLPGHDVISSRGPHVSPEEDRTALVESLSRAVEPVARRPFLFKMLQAVGGLFGIAALFPLASLGPRPHRSLYQTAWKGGVRLVTEDSTPIKLADLPVNGILTVFPEGHLDDALSPAVLLNLGDAPFQVLPGRQGWNIGGVVSFSKICTHAGCPVGLYNVESHQLVCPCHQSTFNILSDCKPVFGPASRSLPQLPIQVNQDGYIIAQSGFDQPVGPGFWNRG